MRFRLVAPDGKVLDEGEGVAEMIGGALHVSPKFGQPLRLAPSDILAISEPEPYAVRLALAEGPHLELRQLGVLRTQILAQLADARGDEVADTMLLAGVGTPEVFPGSVNDREAEIRLYDDALVTISASGNGEKAPYPFIRDVTTDASGYRVTLDVAGGAPMALHRMARRTSEFVDRLSERHRAAAGRTSHFLGALLPGLGPIALRSVANLLRDGLAARKSDLDGIDATIWPALAAAAALPDRVACLSALASMGQVLIGFKQMTSVRRGAEGVTPWSDSAATPNFDHDGHAGSFGSGLGGMMGAAVMDGGPPRDLGFNGPFQAMGSALALSMLGTGGFGGFGGAFGGGMGAGGRFGAEHDITPRASVERGRLTPARVDHDAMTVSGEDPTVLAFALCLTESGHLVYEVLNQGDHATYLYRARDADAAIAVNRALDLVGFRVEPIYADADSAGSKYRKAAQRLPALRVLREAFAGRVAHTDGWERALRDQVAQGRFGTA